MHKGIYRLLLVFCSGMLVLSGCAKEQVVKKDDTALTPSATPQTVEKTEPVPTAPIKEQVVTTPTIKESPIASEEPASTVSASDREQVAKLLSSIYFDFDSSTLLDASRDTLSRNADVLLKKMTKVKIQIEGHCDERGSAEYNLALGERRAKSALNYLVSLGVPSSRLSTISYGKEKPADPGHDETAWAKNRRAEFVAAP